MKNKLMSLFLAAAMIACLVPFSVVVSAEGVTIDVTSAAELKDALNRSEEVDAVNIISSFDIEEDCIINYDSGHLEYYHDTVVTVAEGVTVTVKNGGVFGSMWPSYEGDWETPPLPNGKVINNGTVIVDDCGALEADFDTNNGTIIVKAGGSGVVCNKNYGVIKVESGAWFSTSQGTRAENHGTIEVEKGAVMESRFGTTIVNSEDGTIDLKGDFVCGCLGFDGGVLLFENDGNVTGNGKVLLISPGSDPLPEPDMDKLIERMMSELGQETRFDNWDDIEIYKEYIVSNYDDLKSHITGMRTVAGETVEGDMDVVFYCVGDIVIPEGESIETMALIGVADPVTVTVSDGAVLEAGIESRGVINVLPGGTLQTTMGSNIINNNVLNVAEGATLKSQMGASVVNEDGATLTLDGEFFCGCAGIDGNDVCWFENRGETVGHGRVTVYEADHDFAPVSDLDALIEKVMNELGQETRYDDWDDIEIYRYLEVSCYEELAAALTGERVVAGERVEGDMDTIITLTGDVEIPAGATVSAMAEVTVPDGVTITINEQATLQCGIENYGYIYVLSGGNLFTTMGGSIRNHCFISVAEGATMRSQMGASVVNCDASSLFMDGELYCGCIGIDGNDICWFENEGIVEGEGKIFLYEADADKMPVSDMGAVIEQVTEQLKKYGQTPLDVTAVSSGEVRKGDVDGDGRVGLNDILLIRKFSALIIDLDGAVLAAADVNSDGFINMKDVLEIMRIIAG